MIDITWARCATSPREHQKDGVRALLKMPYFALFDEVGAGKSKQVIDAAQLLYEDGQIDTVVVAAPAFARGVWANPDPNLGEIAKHGWESIPNYVIEYSVSHPKALLTDAQGLDADNATWLRWVITNYEFIRREERLDPLLAYLKSRRYWLVADEAWSLKDHATAQWKAMAKLRAHCQRVTILNGTPIADNPLDLYAQMRLLHPSILSTPYINKWGKEAYTGYTQFRARYAILKPNVSFPMVIGWQNLEELRAKISPFVLRRKTRECFDLPAVLEPVMIEAKLTEENWRLYKQMRDEMVAWLVNEEGQPTGEASITQQAIVKSMRLSQITSGFLGGIQQIDLEEEPELDPSMGSLAPMMGTAPPPIAPREIGREKLDATIKWLHDQPEQQERILIWCKFRLEVERTARVLGEHRRTHMLYGQQPRAEREAAVAALNPDVAPGEPVAVVGNAQAGGAALNLSGASIAITLSHDPKLRVFLQARGRIDRPGQRNEIRYVDVVATGPKGQRSIDHHILAALRGKEDIAKWTAATWRTKLLEE